MTAQRVLVVDDDPTVREVLGGYLERAGFTVSAVSDGGQAVDLLERVTPDLVVLDLTLPGLDGLEVFRRMRAVQAHLPVVILTARGEESDRVLGLEMGADDYVGKPFSSRELVLRIQSVLRRAARSAPPAGQPARLVDGDLVVDVVRHEARLAGRPLMLTAREFELLAHLMAHPGVACSRADLMRDVWGWQFGDETTVTVHVRRLREKIEQDASAPVRLSTVWGVGYRWDGALGRRS